MHSDDNKAITDIKNISENAFQDIVNKAKSLSEPKKEKSKHSSNTEDNDLNHTAIVLIMIRLRISYLEGCIINIGNFSVGINS